MSEHKILLMSLAARLAVVGALTALLTSGCRTTPPVIPLQVDMRPLPAQTGESASFSGNMYTIWCGTPTNASTQAQVTNRMPKRVHIEMSLDGGQTWPRRIAYGVPTVNDRREVTYEYSLPWYDESVLTEQARLRVTDLDGVEISRSDRDFTVAGIFIHRPIADAHFATEMSVEWFQSGAGSNVEIMLLRPDSQMQLLNNINTAHYGVNTVDIGVYGMEIGLCRVVVRSSADQKLYGISQPIYLD